MEIKILGASCAKCKSLEKRVRKILSDNRLDYPVIKVTDYNEIFKYNVLAIPVLVINEEVKCVGAVPSEKVISGWLLD